MNYEKRCDTCNAGYDNSLERLIRCGTCIYRPDGNTNWRPIKQSVKQKRPQKGKS